MRSSPPSDRSARQRRFYARYVTLRGGAADPRIEAAFAAVKREDFLGPGPWWLPGGPAATGGARLGYFLTPDADTAYIYQDILVALAREKRINNGEPSLHARCLQALAVRDDETVLHVGAGTGYYSAILARLAGRGGRVIAYEVEPALAVRARENLWDVPNAALLARSGIGDHLPPADVIYVNAGLTQPEPSWLAALRPGGRLLFPLQPADRFGGMLLIIRPVSGDTWPARFVCRAGFIACDGMQDAANSEALTKAFVGDSWQHVRALRLNSEPDATCWVAGKDWWLASERQ
jgi:protein-L-isoaspartate(D-aspartate) O-methyltransferase